MMNPSLTLRVGVGGCCWRRPELGPYYRSMRDYVLLYVNGRRHAVRGAAVFQPLAEFLRSTLRLTGTKVVCAEGDCGSCSVLVGRPRGERLHYLPITACIQAVAQLDAAHVITVEGLAEGGRLNPVQEAMIAQHGA